MNPDFISNLPNDTVLGNALPNLIGKPRKRLEEVPHEVLISIRVRMYALGSLVWDYVDTVLNLTAQMKIAKTKPLSRVIKKLRRDYEIMRDVKFNREHQKREIEWSLAFEEFVDEYNKTLIEETKAELQTEFSTIDSQTKWLMLAVQQAWCMLQALMVYTRGCDMALSQYGVDMAHQTLLPTAFGRLALLLPAFGGDMLHEDSPARDNAAAAIAKELAKTAVTNGDNLLPMPEI